MINYYPAFSKGIHTSVFIIYTTAINECFMSSVIDWEKTLASILGLCLAFCCLQCWAGTEQGYEIPKWVWWEVQTAQLAVAMCIWEKRIHIVQKRLGEGENLDRKCKTLCTSLYVPSLFCTLLIHVSCFNFKDSIKQPRADISSNGWQLQGICKRQSDRLAMFVNVLLHLLLHLCILVVSWLLHEARHCTVIINSKQPVSFIHQFYHLPAHHSDYTKTISLTQKLITQQS